MGGGFVKQVGFKPGAKEKGVMHKRSRKSKEEEVIGEGINK